MINAGKYNKKISIISIVESEDSAGFKIKSENTILTTFANIRTTKGFTLITNNTDFEKAYINFTIRYPKKIITRDMLIKYNEKIYTIEYINNINEANIELEIQAKVVEK
jgi:SPP1 family predicted phage head-tail adaptor